MRSDGLDLDVTLSKDGWQRRWEIRRAPALRGWLYSATNPNGSTAGIRASEDNALAKRREFDREIHAAREDGWM